MTATRTRIRTICGALLVAAPGIALAVALQREASYSGFDGNDLGTHAIYVRLLLNAFRRGSLGLDAWDAHSSFGIAIFRVYQNLPHFLTAALCLLAHSNNVARAVHLTTVLCVAIQPIAFFFAARLAGLSMVVSLASAWFSPLIRSGQPYGHELGSYLFGGYGLFTQAPGIICFLIAFGAATRVFSAAADSAAEKRNVTLLVAWASLTLLMHLFFGYMLFLYIVSLAVWALMHRTQRRLVLRRLIALALGSVAITGYQLLSIAQDGPLMQRTPFFDAKHWDGLGLWPVVRALFRGEMLDYGRLPILTGMAAVGLMACARKRASRGERSVLILLLLGVVFDAGRTTFGSLIDLLPGARHVQLERFVSMIHLAGIFLAARGLECLYTGVRYRRPKLLRHTALGWVGVASLVGLLVPPIADGLEFLKRNDELLQKQQSINAGLDRRLFESAEADLRRGYLWASTAFDPRHPLLGGVPFYNVATGLGYSQRSMPDEMMMYPSDALPLFNPKREDLYRLFDISTIIIPVVSVRKAPPFFEKRYAGGGLTTLVNSVAGHWDVVGISEVKQVKDENEFLTSVAAWLKDKSPSDNHYPSFVPKPVVERWPSALPKLSSAGPDQGWGSVIKEDPPIGEKWGAVLFARRAGAYGLLRLAYHPRWQIHVNGKPVPPEWIGYGYVGFPLELGRNEVEIIFPSDGFRSALFLFGMVVLVVCLAGSSKKKFL